MLRYLIGTSALVMSMLTTCYGQSVEKLSDGYVTATAPLVARPVATDSIKAASKAEKVHAGMSMGTSVSFGSTGSGTNTWLAPNLSYRVSPRFTVAAGLLLQMNTGNRYAYPSTDANSMSFFRPSTSSLIYASGSYDLNKKTRLTGTLFGGTQVYDLPGMKPSSYNLNTYGGSLNVEYKLNERSSISVGAQISHGPLDGSGYGSPASPLHNDVR